MSRKFLLAAALALAPAAGARAQNPPSATTGPSRGVTGARSSPGFGRRTFDTAALERGKSAFSANCASCHGIDARGGDGGPDLARSLIVMEDENGAAIGEMVRTGRPDKGMPAFAGLTPPQISDIAVFLHERVEVARSSIASADKILVGDPKAGAAYFNGAGKCNSCHSVGGDLKGIASKYDAIALQDKFVNPRAGRVAVVTPRNQKTVKVTLASGQIVSGTLLYISEFAVTLADQAGQRRTFDIDGPTPKVEVTDPLQAHLDLLQKYTDKDMHDLTAYLVTLK
jgi:mono/diheme cytochrome c family protein